MLQETKQMQSSQDDTTQKDHFAHWRKGHLISVAVRSENMPHGTMGCLRQREWWASQRFESVLDDSKEVLCQCGCILEWILYRGEDSLVKQRLDSR